MLATAHKEIEISLQNSVCSKYVALNARNCQTTEILRKLTDGTYQCCENNMPNTPDMSIWGCFIQCHLDILNYSHFLLSLQKYQALANSLSGATGP